MSYVPPNQGPTGYGAPLGGTAQPVPPSVNIASILLFVVGGLAVLGGLLLLAVASISALFIPVALLVLAIGALEIYTGVQLRKLVPWARTVTIVLAGVGALLQLLSIAQSPVSSVIGLALNGYIIYLMYRPDTLAVFPASTRPGGI